MPLDPAITAWLAAQPAPSAPLTLAELRRATDAGLIQQQGEDRDAAWQQQLALPAADGTPLRVRIYVPYARQGESNLPALVWAHGGGWSLGSLEAWNRPCRQLAESTGRVVLAVDYRLAPEPPYPLPLEDFYAALCGIHQQAAVLRLDAAQIAVGGDSAGGNLAAADCLLARERGGPDIAHQLLLWPALDATMSSASYQQFATGYGLTAEMMQACWQYYAGNDAVRHAGHNTLDNTGYFPTGQNGARTSSPQPLFSPLATADLRGLPPATILSCEYDPLRDEAEAYAARLTEAGVRVRVERLAGQIHGAMHMTAVTEQAEKCYQRAAFF